MMRHFLRRLCRSERGAAAVEYGLLAAFIGLGISAALMSSKASLNQTYACLSGSLRTLTPCGQSPADQSREAILSYLVGAIPNRVVDMDAMAQPIRSGSVNLGGGLMQSLGSIMVPNADGTFTRQGLCNAVGDCMAYGSLEQGNPTYIETAPGSKTYYNQTNSSLMLYKADDGTWYGTITKPKV
jgi:Flp pilus assembly pilin Flp